MPACSQQEAGSREAALPEPVPIRLVHDRWVSKYVEPRAATLSTLKNTLEDEVMEEVFEIYADASESAA